MLYPLKLSYSPVFSIWGGTKLIRSWNKQTADDRLAESWELSVRNDGRMSRIENGADAGLSLLDYIKLYGNQTVSDNYNGGHFPILVKLIDASEKLSVQVHPDDIYAAENENDSGKTELWYILEAEPGAKILYGIKDSVGVPSLINSISQGKTEGLFSYIEVKAGESYFIPSGLPHAIGKGILVAEIQQNSDLTYRLFDYNRLGVNGKLRKLHLKKAFDVIRKYSESDINALRFEKGKDNAFCIANCRYFNVNRLKLNGSSNYNADKASFHCILCINGKAIIIYNNVSYTIMRGECYYIPATMGEYSINGDVEYLIIKI